MNKTDIILIGGIVLAGIWLMTYIIFENKKNKKITLMVGAVLDIVLYCICLNSGLLLVGIVGGIIFGLVPWLGSRRKYSKALKETGGSKNLTLVMVIFFVMIFMFAAIAYPEIKVTF